MSHDINDEGHFDDKVDIRRAQMAAKYLHHVQLFSKSIETMTERISDLYELIESEDEAAAGISGLIELEEVLRVCLLETTACIYGLIGYDELVPEPSDEDLELATLKTLANLDNIDTDMVFAARKQRIADILRNKYGFGL